MNDYWSHDHHRFVDPFVRYCYHRPRPCNSEQNILCILRINLMHSMNGLVQKCCWIYEMFTVGVTTFLSILIMAILSIPTIIISAKKKKKLHILCEFTYEIIHTKSLETKNKTKSINFSLRFISTVIHCCFMTTATSRTTTGTHSGCIAIVCIMFAFNLHALML